MKRSLSHTFIVEARPLRSPDAPTERFEVDALRARRGPRGHRAAPAPPRRVGHEEGAMTAMRCCSCPRCKRRAEALTVPPRCETCRRCGCTSDLPRCTPVQPPAPSALFEGGPVCA